MEIELTIPTFCLRGHPDCAANADSWKNYKPIVGKVLEGKPDYRRMQYKSEECYLAAMEVERVKNIVAIEEDGWSSGFEAPTSTHGLAGKVWVLNRTTGHRTRIDVSEVVSYEANGYVKGGPRSK